MFAHFHPNPIANNQASTVGAFLDLELGVCELLSNPNRCPDSHTISYVAMTRFGEGGYTSCAMSADRF